ncbi:hypothetical protein KR018_005148, partial [Drosophila ironensis]
VVSRKVVQFIYATLLSTILMTTPKVNLQFEVLDSQTTVDFIYPDLKSILLTSALATLLAMAPITVFPSNWLITYPKVCVVPVLVWGFLSYLGFVTNVMVHLRAIAHLIGGTNAYGVMATLVFYFAVFGMLVEQVMHWYSVHVLLRD